MTTTPGVGELGIAGVLHAEAVRQNPGHAEWTDCAVDGPCANDARLIVAHLRSVAADGGVVEAVARGVVARHPENSPETYDELNEATKGIYRGIARAATTTFLAHLDAARPTDATTTRPSGADGEGRGDE